MPLAPPPKDVPSIEGLLKEATELLHKAGCADLAARVRLQWNPRMRSTAGMAFSAEALIVLNPKLIAFGVEEIDRTLRHELAHLVAHHRNGSRRIAAHGPEWKAACIDLGLVDENRCHNLPLPRRQMERRYIYRCAGCGIEVPRVRPLRRKSACIVCCRLHARGLYDERFRFVKVKPER